MMLAKYCSQPIRERVASFWKRHLVAAPLKRDEVIVLDEDHFHKRNNKKYMIKPDVPEAGFQINAPSHLIGWTEQTSLIGQTRPALIWKPHLASFIWRKHLEIIL